MGGSYADVFGLDFHAAQEYRAGHKARRSVGRKAILDIPSGFKLLGRAGIDGFGLTNTDMRRRVTYRQIPQGFFLGRLNKGRHT